MSDEITVRVTLDRFDLMSTTRQTQVYVQIPEVARASWLLPAEEYEGLRDSKWGDVLDEAITHFEYRKRQGWVTDPASAAARQSVRDWLAVDENRDALDDAWFLDAARRHPVSRTLLRMVTQLGEQLTDCEQRSERRRIAWRMAYQRAQGRGWAADRAEARARDAQEALQHMLFTVFVGQLALRASSLENEQLKARIEELAPADGISRQIVPVQALREDEARPPLTVFRTSYDAEEMGLFATREAAHAQCEAHERTHWLGNTTVFFKWVPDDDEENSPEELWASLAGDADGSETGYVVTPLVVPSEYDEEADE